MPAFRLCHTLAGLLLGLTGLMHPAWGAIGLQAPAEVQDLLQRFVSREVSLAPQADSDSWRALERQLQRAVSELLATEGYFAPTVQLDRSTEPEVLRVEPGAQTRVGQVQIELRGLDPAAQAALIAGWALPSGSAFRQSAWDDAKRRLLHALDSDTYIAARLVHSAARVDVPSATADLELALEAGPAHRYGALQIEGLQRYRAATVARYLAGLQPGQPVRRAQLLALQAALQSAPYFSAVQVDIDREAATPDPTTPDSGLVVPVRIRVRERAPYDVALGMGASSNTGARVEVGLRNADLFHRAWEGRAGARLEQLKQSAFADVFFLPDPSGGRASTGTMWEHSNIQGLDLQQAGAALAYTRTRDHLERSTALTWRQERRTQSDATTTRQQALAVSLGWVWRDAQDPDDPAEGVVLQWHLAAASRALASDQTFVRSHLRYSQGFPLTRRSSVLLRAELGITAARARDGIPQDYLFRAGGANSVRGYAYQSLGVVQGTATLGGRYLGALSSEFLYWHSPDWGTALFVDAGQAADNRRDLKPVFGYGLGARWKSPAGPLGLDLAWSERDRRLRLHFALSVPI